MPKAIKRYFDIARDEDVDVCKIFNNYGKLMTAQTLVSRLTSICQGLLSMAREC